VLPAAVLVNASPRVLHDWTVYVSRHPLQLLPVEVLQRPIESAQYLSIRYTERLANAGIELSVGSRGDAYDNALAETIIGLFKAEVIRPRGPWRTLEAVEFATLDWVDWFNTQRLLEPLGYVPPAEYEANYYKQATVA
jgi:transposase InsO family protein